MVTTTLGLNQRVCLRINPSFKGKVARITATRHRNPIRLYVVKWDNDPQPSTHRLGDLQCSSISSR